MENNNNARVSAREVFLTILKKEQFLNLPMYFLVLIPFVICVWRICSEFDRKFGFQPFVSFPVNLVAFVILTFAGILTIWWAYGHLVILGEGSPAPHLGGTKKLVTSGPYAFIRHPSVIGKFMGVVGFGFLTRSVTFTFICVPLFFLYSALYNRFVQEYFCVRKFGQAYLDYRKQVPMFIPKPGKLKGLFNKRRRRCSIQK